MFSEFRELMIRSLDFGCKLMNYMLLDHIHREFTTGLIQIDDFDEIGKLW
ncbi:hypothetical protein Scep_025660 [Stephania cephalantha]|uniref:Uncharacterized protein n=1 Tax=Stephania cephalantha TaxID=152367 RepID=A0AAP0EIM9_9MAGN